MISSLFAKGKDSSLQQVLDQAIDAIVTINEHNIVTYYYNSAAEGLWGYTT